MITLNGRIGVVLAVPLLFIGLYPAHSQTMDPEIIERATIIFTGTVTKTAAVTLASLSPSGRTIIIRVDQVIDKPAAVSLSEGNTLTVEVIDASAFPVGSRAAFYTEGWIFGKGLAVRELGHVMLTAAAAGLAPSGAAGEVTTMRQDVSDAKLRARIQAAAVVIVGRVREIRAAQMLSVTLGPGPLISEHNANWQEAVIAVDSSFRGARVGEDIVVRFPGSYDIAFRDMPKFRAGQEGTFLLQQDSVTGARTLLAGTEVPAYTAATTADVLPRTAASRVRALMR